MAPLHRGWRPAPGAVAIDFNARLNLQVLYQHTPLEFAFLWADRLAFWHVDMLMPRVKLATASSWFDRLADGEMAAFKTYGGIIAARKNNLSNSTSTHSNAAKWTMNYVWPTF